MNLTAQHLTPTDPIQPGDILVEIARTAPGYIIRVGEALWGHLNRANHCGVVASVVYESDGDGGDRQVGVVAAEAYGGKGHQLHVRDLANFSGVIVRIPQLGPEIANAALERLNAPYAWEAIARYTLWTLARPLPRPLRRVVAAAADRIPQRTGAVICSQAVIEAIDAAAGATDALGLDTPAWNVSPAGLADRLAGRRRDGWPL